MALTPKSVPDILSLDYFWTHRCRTCGRILRHSPKSPSCGTGLDLVQFPTDRHGLSQGPYPMEDFPVTKKTYCPAFHCFGRRKHLVSRLVCLGSPLVLD